MEHKNCRVEVTQRGAISLARGTDSATFFLPVLVTSNSTKLDKVIREIVTICFTTDNRWMPILYGHPRPIEGILHEFKLPKVYRSSRVADIINLAFQDVGNQVLDNMVYVSNILWGMKDRLESAKAVYHTE